MPFSSSQDSKDSNRTAAELDFSRCPSLSHSVSPDFLRESALHDCYLSSGEAFSHKHLLFEVELHLTKPQHLGPKPSLETQKSGTNFVLQQTSSSLPWECGGQLCLLPGVQV